MSSSNTSNMAQNQINTSSAANTSSRVRNTPSNIRTTDTASPDTNYSTATEASPRSWIYDCRSPKTNTPCWAPNAAERAEMAERESNLSKNKKKNKRTADPSNSPSSIKFSPLTLFSQATGSSFGINRSPVADSPCNIEADVDKFPKNDSPANAGFPIKKIKEKKKGISDLSRSNKAKDKRKNNKSLAWSKKNNVLLEDEPPTPPLQNTTPAHNRRNGFTYIVCNKEAFPLNEKNRQQHVDGRPHKQIKGMLAAHRDRDDDDEPLPTDLFRDGTRKWKCHACDDAIQKPHVLTDTVRDHLERHADMMRIRWAKFKEMARSVAGLRENEIPDDVARSFI
jgi:hypothetical protein